jgi:hypothetical protein
VLDRTGNAGSSKLEVDFFNVIFAFCLSLCLRDSVVNSSLADARVRIHLLAETMGKCVDIGQTPDFETNGDLSTSIASK